ncbi:MotA/TolQ/ExbB proton channel family protein [Chrysiogenes arsenatis]|uniref:MotA/TolQ/ExbB proton channel family protein n=1 Tax=Chrysiogenes arsenatis TaxID=309797 RepID=UPI0004065092|nr:MotA/TolQ/ExbB proton channel family protein [Chrysiogenes arsenatis]
MSFIFQKIASLLIIIPLLAGMASAGATLDLFLKEVQRQSLSEKQMNAEREQKFSSDLATARQQVAEAKQQLQREQERQARLTKSYEANEAALMILEESLRQHQGSLGEVFGVVRQNAGDYYAQYLASLAMADKSQALEFIKQLGDSRVLPSIEEIEKLWITALQEMADSGKVQRMPSEIVAPDGRKRAGDILRIGAFNAVADGKYLSHVEGRNQFVELPRQPQSRHLKQAQTLENAAAGQTVMFAVDPSRGMILSQLVQSPSLLERIHQGREIGMIIIALGIFGLVLFLARYSWLFVVGQRMKHQMGSEAITTDNPLGRILSLYEQNRAIDAETLEVKLDEEVLREIPRLEWGLTTIKILAAVAPLLGLLGTVVGMIETFQAITLFGTGDPQLMAGGISQALVTTALGLVVAIPLLFLHNLASAKSRYLVNVMEEQGAGLLAKHMAKQRTGYAHG